MAHSMDQKPPKMAKIDNENEAQVSYKVTILRRDPECDWEFDKIFEVRRFALPKDGSTSLIYLKERIRALFVNQIKNGEILKIYWKDKDGDFIRVMSDQDLLIGLNENKEVFNLTVLAGPGTLIVTEDNASYLAHVH